MLRTWAVQIPSCACVVTRHPAPADRGHPGECLSGDRAGVALSYLTPDGPWHTI
ncbi:hypothetical protein GCM10027075_47950 [Streptomyces heilongjiangensis]